MTIQVIEKTSFSAWKNLIPRNSNLMKRLVSTNLLTYPVSLSHCCQPSKTKHISSHLDSFKTHIEVNIFKYNNVLCVKVTFEK